jgi:23S rRNA (guanine745-N1)-methyltransferase
MACPDGHSYDLARQGYVDLSGGRRTHDGDTAAMIAARAALLGAGHLSVVTDGIVAAVRAAAAPADVGAAPLVVDVGAGTGHHLAGLLDAEPGLVGLAVDVSKPALRRAARAHPRMERGPERTSGAAFRWPPGRPACCSTCSPPAPAPSSTGSCARTAP